MGRKTLLLLTSAGMFLLCGCMSEREYMLRRQDVAAKQAWPATYQPIVIRGPLTLDKDSELVITVPNQPFQHTPIPDGQAAQIGLAKDALHTAAILGGAIYSIRKANGSSTTNITNNNAAETAK